MALLPLHLDIPGFEAILPGRERIFVMPWYSQEAGRFYHERLLETNLDRRVETAAFAMRVDYKPGDVPVLVFPMVLEHAADADRLRTFLAQLASFLTQEPLALRPMILVYGDAEEKAAAFDFGDLPAHVTVHEIETFDLTTNKGNSLRERPAVNCFAHRLAGTLSLAAAKHGLSLSAEDATAILVRHGLRLTQSGFWPTRDATDESISNLCEHILESALSNILSEELKTNKRSSRRGLHAQD